jgi:hypothetical protein
MGRHPIPQAPVTTRMALDESSLCVEHPVTGGFLMNNVSHKADRIYSPAWSVRLCCMVYAGTCDVSFFPSSFAVHIGKYFARVMTEDLSGSQGEVGQASLYTPQIPNAARQNLLTLPDWDEHDQQRRA